MTCPHEQLRGRCYHPSLAPWPGNCLDDDTCPGGFGPWGAWRAFVAPYCQSWALLCDTPDRLAANMAYVFLVMYASEEFGWTP